MKAQATNREQGNRGAASAQLLAVPGGDEQVSQILVRRSTAVLGGGDEMAWKRHLLSRGNTFPCPGFGGTYIHWV